MLQEARRHTLRDARRSAFRKSRQTFATRMRSRHLVLARFLIARTFLLERKARKRAPQAEGNGFPGVTVSEPISRKPYNAGRSSLFLLYRSQIGEQSLDVRGRKNEGRHILALMADDYPFAQRFFQIGQRIFPAQRSERRRFGVWTCAPRPYGMAAATKTIRYHPSLSDEGRRLRRGSRKRQQNNDRNRFAHGSFHPAGAAPFYSASSRSGRWFGVGSASKQKFKGLSCFHENTLVARDQHRTFGVAHDGFRV
jgi:hypothetical protein